MNFVIERGNINDIDELLRLYFLIYQNNYPLAICSDRNIMADALKDSGTYWYVTRETSTKSIVASTVFETDAAYRIGKLVGVVVHPDFRKQDLATKMIAKGAQELLMPVGPLRSIYTTTRTNARGPQIMCLKNRFLPLGIFPNAHKIEEFETLTLMAKFAEGVLENKSPFAPVSEKIAPILQMFQQALGIHDPIRIAPYENIAKDLLQMPQNLKFEFITAPHYVLRRFNDVYSDPYDRFFPFHKPNILLASTNGEIEIFGYINEADGHLAIVALNKPIVQLRKRIRHLLYQLRDYGVSYIEILIGIQFTTSINVLLEAQFLPSAIYPAMCEIDGKVSDFVVMTRTLEPLNFAGMQIESGFKPYVDLYVKLWKEMHLETLEVFNDYSK